MNAQTKEHTFNVWGFRDHFQVFHGIVKGVNQTLATKRAMTLYGAGTWTTPRD